MKTKTIYRHSAIVLMLLISFFCAATLVFADHSEEEENESHATTLNTDAEPVSVAVHATSSADADANVLRLKALLAALEELLELLQYQKEHMDATNTDVTDHNGEDHA